MWFSDWFNLSCLVKETALSQEMSFLKSKPIFWFLDIHGNIKPKFHDVIVLQLDMLKLSKLSDSQNFEFPDMTFIKVNVNGAQFVSVYYSYQICTSFLLLGDTIPHTPFCSSGGHSISSLWSHFELKEITFFQTKTFSNVFTFQSGGFV